MCYTTIWTDMARLTDSLLTVHCNSSGSIIWKETSHSLIIQALLQHEFLNSSEPHETCSKLFSPLPKADKVSCEEHSLDMANSKTTKKICLMEMHSQTSNHIYYTHSPGIMILCGAGPRLPSSIHKTSLMPKGTTSHSFLRLGEAKSLRVQEVALPTLWFFRLSRTLILLHFYNPCNVIEQSVCGCSIPSTPQIFPCQSRIAASKPLLSAAEA